MTRTVISGKSMDNVFSGFSLMLSRCMRWCAGGLPQSRFYEEDSKACRMTACLRCGPPQPFDPQFLDPQSATYCSAKPSVKELLAESHMLNKERRARANLSKSHRVVLGSAVVGTVAEVVVVVHVAVVRPAIELAGLRASTQQPSVFLCRRFRFERRLLTK